MNSRGLWIAGLLIAAWYAIRWMLEKPKDEIDRLIDEANRNLDRAAGIQ